MWANLGLKGYNRLEQIRRFDGASLSLSCGAPSKGCQFWWNWWVQVAVAVGTIGAVFVALCGKAIRSKSLLPQLKLTVRSKTGEKTPRIIEHLPNGTVRYEESRYYHLTISNSRADWAPAEDVAAILVGIETKDSAGEYRLAWEGEVPMRWRNQEFVPPTRRIGPKGDCDLCCIGKESGFSLLILFPLTSLTTTAKNAVNTRDIKGAYTIVVRLLARCSNQATPVTFRFELAWSGKWEDGDTEMGREMVVTELPSLLTSK